MKYIAAFLLSIVSAYCIESTVNTVTVPVTSAAPSAALSFNATVKGATQVQAWANGAALGVLNPPYTINFTSVASGFNILHVVICDDTATIQTNLFIIPVTTSSGSRVLPRKLYR